MTHDRGSASAVAQAERAGIKVPLAGRLLYRFLPFRRAVILENLRRVYGETLPRRRSSRSPRRTTPTYGFSRANSSSSAGCRPSARRRWCASRTTMRSPPRNARARACSSSPGISATGRSRRSPASLKYPAFRGRFHFVRRAFKPRWLDALITRRFNQAGFGVIGKRGSLDRILDLLAAGDVIVFPFDQHAAPPDGIEVEFFGIRRGRSGASRSSRSPRARRCCPRRAGARPTARHVMQFRRADRRGRSRGHERSDPPHDARVQRRARAPHPRASRAVVLGASAVEGFCGKVRQAPRALAARTDGPRGLFVAELPRVQPARRCPAAASRSACVPCSDDPSAVEHDDAIAMLDRRQPVRDDDRRAPAHQTARAPPGSAARTRCRAPRSPRRGSGSARP